MNKDITWLVIRWEDEKGESTLTKVNKQYLEDWLEMEVPASYKILKETKDSRFMY